VYEAITSLPQLVTHLQWAFSVELSTIPPYLCALYSVIDRSTAAAKAIRDVAIEEMLHMALVSNLMNAVGKRPSLAPKWVPVYPGYIPHHAAGGPFIQLAPLSQGLARTVFMTIERPELAPTAPAEGDEFETIGQFYKAIELGFETVAGEDPGVFDRDTGCQRSDIYFGAGGGELMVVEDLESAMRALAEITEQGEGAPLAHPPLPGEEPFGTYDGYGARADGTYGPIIGTPWEMSHYRRFEQLAGGEIPIPATYPMQPNPSLESLVGPVLQLAELFDACWTLVLTSLERTLGTKGGERAFFENALPLMQFALPQLATVLMQTPLQEGADPALGPNAGPRFLYRKQGPDEIVAVATALKPSAPDLGTDYNTAWAAALDATVEAVETRPRARVLGWVGGKPQS
jgi:hypothetical protein